MAAPFAAAAAQPVVALPGRQVLTATAAVFGVSEARILSACQDRATVRPRQALCFALRERLGWTLPRIARFMDRDHTTVLYSVEKARAVAATDPDFAASLREVMARVGVPE